MEYPSFKAENFTINPTKNEKHYPIYMITFNNNKELFLIEKNENPVQ